MGIEEYVKELEEITDNSREIDIPPSRVDI